MHLIWSIIISLFGLYTHNIAHDIHVSVTDIEIQRDGHIEIVVKVFLDDLMQSVGLELGAELPDDYTSSDDLITKFLANNLSVMINGDAVECLLEDTTPSSPAVWITLIGKATEEINSIEIINKILIDQFDDQSNMINVSYKGKSYSELLDIDQTKYLVPVGQ